MSRRMRFLLVVEPNNGYFHERRRAASRIAAMLRRAYPETKLKVSVILDTEALVDRGMEVFYSRSTPPKEKGTPKRPRKIIPDGRGF